METKQNPEVVEQPPGEDEGKIDPHQLLHELTTAFNGVRRQWPRTLSLTLLIEWLEVKRRMLEMEAARWSRGTAKRGAYVRKTIRSRQS